MLKEKLHYCIAATTVRMNTIRIHTTVLNTDMFKGMQNMTVGFSPKQKVLSNPLIFFTAVSLYLFCLSADGE